MITESTEDKATGLGGYVFQKEGTDELVISFRGTEFNGIDNLDRNDIGEFIHEIITDDSDYTKGPYENTI